MARDKKVHARTLRRAMRTKKSLKIGSLPRVSVFRSLNNIYAQVIDDNAQRTLVSCSSLETDISKGAGADADKKAVARSVGKELAQRALKSGIDRVCFDRGSYLYHGRIKELAEGLREGGLQV